VLAAVSDDAISGVYWYLINSCKKVVVKKVQENRLWKSRFGDRNPGSEIEIPVRRSKSRSGDRNPGPEIEIPVRRSILEIEIPVRRSILEIEIPVRRSILEIFD
jgi:hypothetical protein